MLLTEQHGILTFFSCWTVAKNVIKNVASFYLQ
ncbi:hypothetical protein V12B01_13015 [Vibrio splendidus 12B01]|nr:hypothetical protein V12B01_13015 [Vibrio splendidus 12B01]